MSQVVRRATHAGSWYTDDRTELAGQLSSWLSKVQPTDCGAARAIIAPHAGYLYSGPTAAVSRQEERAFVPVVPHTALSRCCHAALANLRCVRAHLNVCARASLASGPITTCHATACGASSCWALRTTSTLPSAYSPPAPSTPPRCDPSASTTPFTMRSRRRVPLTRWIWPWTSASTHSRCTCRTLRTSWASASTRSFPSWWAPSLRLPRRAMVRCVHTLSAGAQRRQAPHARARAVSCCCAC